MSKLKPFSIGHTLVGSTSLAIGVAKQQDSVDLRMVAEENHNLVLDHQKEEEEGVGEEKSCKNEESYISIALAPALISSGKLATDVVDEASRFVEKLARVNPT